VKIKNQGKDTEKMMSLKTRKT